MSLQLKHGTGENFQGPCDLIFSQLLGQLHPRLKGTPVIVVGHYGFSQAQRLWTFCPNLEEIGTWGRNKNRAVWAGNMPKATIELLRAVQIDDLVEEQSWMPAELPRRLLAAYPGKKDVVADPFMDHATVGKAVLEYGGRFIGLDRLPERVRFAHDFLCAQP